jgi:hypothetical protein
LLLLSVCYEALRLPERTRSAKFTLVLLALLVAEAGFEPTTQRL